MTNQTPERLEDGSRATMIDESTGEILTSSTETASLVAPDMSGTDLGDAPLSWNALVRISSTEFVPRALRGKPDAVLAAVFTGREIGLGPLASLRLVDVIDGTPSLSAELTVALIRAAGHRLILVDESPSSCTVQGIRRENPDDVMTVMYTLDDAEAAGLVSLDDNGRPRARSRQGAPMPWERYTSDLLWARAVTRLARRHFPDVTAAPARTVVAAFSEPATVPIDAPDIDEARFWLATALDTPLDPGASAVEHEAYMRRICRLSVACELFTEDPLRGIVSRFGTTHVSSLTAGEIREAAATAHEIITAAVAARYDEPADTGGSG